MDIDIQEVCIGKFTGTNDEVRGMFRRAILDDLQAHYEPNQVIITFTNKQAALDWIAPYTYGANPTTYKTLANQLRHNIEDKLQSLRSGRTPSDKPNYSNIPQSSEHKEIQFTSNSSLANQIHDIESGNVIER